MWIVFSNFSVENPFCGVSLCFVLEKKPATVGFSFSPNYGTALIIVKEFIFCWFLILDTGS